MHFSYIYVSPLKFIQSNYGFFDHTTITFFQELHRFPLFLDHHYSGRGFKCIPDNTLGKEYSDRNRQEPSKSLQSVRSAKWKLRLLIIEKK